jgi:hypothetical protein
MRTFLIFSAVAPLFVVFAACAKKPDDTPPPATAATAYPPQGYPPPQATYAQPYPNQYPPPAATYAQPAPAPGAPAQAPPGYAPAPAVAPAATGQMAVPGPIAFQCQNDVPCGTHHCNVQYGKCAFPCQSAADCLTPNQCMAGLCVPAPPQAH